MRQISTFDSPEAIAPIMDQQEIVAEINKRKKKKPSKTKMAAADFGMQCVRFNLPKFEREWMFAKGVELPEYPKKDYPHGRKWRFDYAWPQYMLAVEIDGFVVRMISGQLIVQGRHATIGGIYEDIEKNTSAVCLGWTVLRFGVKNVSTEYAIRNTMRALCLKGWSGQQSGDKIDE